MYKVNSAVKKWVEESDGIGVPCVQCEAQVDTLKEAIAFAMAHESTHPDEVCEVRDGNDKVVWPRAF